MSPFRVPTAVVRTAIRIACGRFDAFALPWEVQRQRLERLGGSRPLPRGTSVTPAVLAGVPAEIVTVGSGDGTAVVHFHGGGYCVGSPALVRHWAAHLSARAGCRVILPDYRLAPEHPFPAALDDAREVLKAVLAEAAGPVIVSGDSAGGGLALASAAEQTGLAGCVLLSPWLDLTADRTASPELARRDIMLSPSVLEAYAAAYVPVGQDRSRPGISPLHADLAGLPRLLVQYGTDDLLAPDAERLAERARAAGADVTSAPWPGMWHDFMLLAGLISEADSAVSQAAEFLARVRAAA